MPVETKQDLLSLVRAEAGKAFELRDAAAKLAKTADALCRAIGAGRLNHDELKRATESHVAARKALAQKIDGLIDHMKVMNAAAPGGTEA